MKKNILLVTICALISSVILFNDQLQVSGSIITKNTLAQTELAKPKIGEWFTDPVFGTSILRISNAQSFRAAGIVPDYAKRQAWNADESLLLLRTGDGDTLLFNGSTYKYIKTLEAISGEDVFWHPLNREEIIYNPDNTLYSYNINTRERKSIYTFSAYTFANTRGEGNLSADGRWYACVGQTYNEITGEVIFKDLLLFDLQTRQVANKLKITLPIENFDWVSVSPDGKYIVVDYADELTDRFHGVEVYDSKFQLIWQKPLGAGHSDLGMDENGEAVLVMDVYDPEHNITRIKKFNLANGKETILLELSPLFDLHISCRNEKHLGWCFISTFDYVERLTDSSKTWLPFEDEIFVLKMDSSGTVQRLAHHHSRRYSPQASDSDQSNYFAEPHATVNRSGDRIVFGSNWRMNIKAEASVDSYVVDFKKPVDDDKE